MSLKGKTEANPDALEISFARYDVATGERVDDYVYSSKASDLQKRKLDLTSKLANIDAILADYDKEKNKP